jgi:hypothetical protein
LAPPPKRFPDLLAVPIDIQSVRANLTFDATAETALAECVVEFVHGAEDGCPIFDLRQRIDGAWLEEEPIQPAAMAPRDFGGRPDAGLRVLARRCPRKRSMCCGLRIS